ncbi:MAG: NusG domain II-containing protein [Clostridiales bacterium]|nr:NusG domain II-containing protein [Clostridiales bacterium]
MNFENIEKLKKSKPITVLDIILFAVFVVAIGVSFWAVYRRPKSTVLITAPSYSRELSISDNAVIELEHLTVHIELGKVWVTDSDCPDKICEHTGKISRAGESIVCLPYGIVITINGRSDVQWVIGR